MMKVSVTIYNLIVRINVTVSQKVTESNYVEFMKVDRRDGL